jgi:7-cyano-7-deazaguanine synthase in queuosine biosynthesis
MRAVRYVGEAGCSDATYTAALAETPNGVIDTLPGGNVALRFRRDGRPLLVNMAQLSRDLVDIAVMAYITDEMDPRSSAPDRWTRSHHFLVPVHDRALWLQALPVLAKALNRVAGDNFSFTWFERSAVPVKKHRLRLPKGCYDAVCLLSGGIDSLLGAYHLLQSGKKLILLGHQADNITAAAQTVLAGQLALLFPGKTTFVQCRVARSQSEEMRFQLAEKCEDTHRCRSFLFLSLAGAIASTAGVNEIYMPENGLIALNAPLQRSRMGTLSTRTAHPLFLCNYADLLSQLGIFTGALRNPFIYQSKTDMLRGLPLDVIPLVSRSVSCSRPSRYQNLHVRHCGYCVPCIYRRAAMMEAGLDKGINEYAFDAFLHLQDLKDYQKVDFRALVRFAERLATASEIDLVMTVLAHGYFPPDFGARLGPTPATDYSPWTTMLRSWSQDFLRKMRASCSPETLAIVGLNPAAIEVSSR